MAAYRTSVPFRGVGFFDEEGLLVWSFPGSRRFFAVVDYWRREVVRARLEGSTLFYGARVILAAPTRVAVVSKPWERKNYAVEFHSTTGRIFSITGTAWTIAKRLREGAYVIHHSLAYPAMKAVLEAFEACGRVGE